MNPHEYREKLRKANLGAEWKRDITSLENYRKMWNQFQTESAKAMAAAWFRAQYARMYDNYGPIVMRGITALTEDSGGGGQ